MYKKSYPLINEIVDEMFPHVKSSIEIFKDRQTKNELPKEQFSDLNYWKGSQNAEIDPEELHKLSK